MSKTAKTATGFQLLSKLEHETQKRQDTETFAVLVRKGQEKIQAALSPEEQRAVRWDASIREKAIAILQSYVESAYLAFMGQPDAGYEWPEGIAEEFA